MSKNKSFYVGGGIAENAFLYAFPIILEYCKLNNIRQIILEGSLKKITQEKVFKKEISNFTIINEKEILPFYLKIKILIVIFFLFRSVKFYLQTNKKNMLSRKKSFFNSQILHGIWDLAQRNARDGQFNYKNGNLSYNKWEVFKASIKSCVKIELAKILIKNEVKSSLIAHAVYDYKSLAAILRKNDIEVLHINSFSIYRQKKFKDTCFTLIDKKLLKLLTTSLVVFRETELSEKASGII